MANSASMRSPQTESRAEKFAGNWTGGARAGRSTRRRIMAMLRASCMTLGLKRKNVGLGSLGMGGKASCLSASTAGALGLALTFGSSTAFAADAVCVVPPANTVAAGTTSGAGNEVACGDGAVASGTNAVAVGNAAKAQTTSAIAIGNNASVNAPAAPNVLNSGIGGIAIGDGATVSAGSGTYPNLAIGYQAQAVGGISATALGGRAAANGTDTVAIGVDAAASGNQSTAVGRSAAASGVASTSLGVSATASSNRATALGYGANAAGNRGTAVGAGSSASGSFALALGVNAAASDANSVALGSGSLTALANPTASGVIAGTSYTYAGATPTSVVSVGSVGTERQIINVAAGRVSATSTDAINGSQLFATNSAITTLQAGQTHYYSVNDGGVAQANYNNDGATGTGSIAAGIYASATGADDVSIGTLSGYGSASTGRSVSVGADAGRNQSGYGNTAVGSASGQGSSGNYNAGLGNGSLYGVVGDGNVAAGGGALQYAQGSGNIGIGFGANSSTALTPYNNAVAVGAAAEAKFDDALALGHDALATNDGDVALGSASETAAAVGTSDVTINGTTYAFAGTSPTSTVSVGAVGGERTITNVAAGRVSATSTDAINGSQLYATNLAIEDLTAVVGASATHYYSVNDGGTQQANYNNDGATGLNAVASGVNATATGAGSYAAGFGATATQPDGVAIGTNAHAVTGGVVALGVNSLSSAQNTIAIGIGSAATTRLAIAIGGATVSSGNGSIAIGDASHATAAYAVGLGMVTTATGSQAVAIGHFADATGISTLAAGYDANATADYATSLGRMSNASAVSALALGNLANASGISSIAIGESAIASNSGSIALGRNTVSSGVNTIAIGTGATATNSVALGAAASAGAGGTALGDGAVATLAGGVALGKNSVEGAANPTASGTINGTTYAYAGTTPTSVVSVGSVGAERQITNVAAGQITATSTDAVNGSQLFATNSAITTLQAGQTHYYSVNDGGVAQANYNNDGATGTGSIAAGVYASAVGADDVSIGTLAGYGSGSTGASVAVGGGAGRNQSGYANTAVGSAAGQGSSGDYNTGLGNGSLYGVIGDRNVSLGTGALQYAQGSSNVAIGYGANGSTALTAFDYAVAIGDASSAKVDDALALGHAATANNIGDVALGASSVTAVAVGTASTIINGTTYNFAGIAPTSTVSVGYVGGERTITNVAAGRISATSTDAINGSQLYATNQAIEDLTDVVAATATHYYSVNDGGTQQANYANDGATGVNSLAAGVGASSSGVSATAVGNNAAASGANSTALGVQATATGANSLALGASAQATNAGDVALGAGSVTAAAVATTGTTINGTSYTFAGTAPTSTVSVGAVGAERTVTNVAAGRISATSTDAINGSQLYATNQAIEAVSQTASAGWNVTTAKTGTGVVNNTTVSNVAPGATATFTAGNNIVVTQNGTEVQVAVNPNLKVDSVAITNGPTIDNTGINMGGKTITNLGAGVNPTDAVNLSQLTQGLSNTLNQANNYTDSRINALNFNLSEFKKDSNGGTAAAMAMSQVPQAFEPGMGIVGMGVSTWQGQQAVAIGFSKASDNGRIIIKATGSYNTRGEGGAAAGVGFQF